jgi:hypothetical protein
MNTAQLSSSLATLFAELTDGAPRDGAYILNTGDAGLLGSLDKLSARDASGSSREGATIAAHVDHLRYGISLMNRWAAGENPFKDADWAAAWRTTAVSDVEWQSLRAALRAEVTRWRAVLAKPREVNETELNGMIGSVAHLAYHLGAIRQIDKAARGPREANHVGTATRNAPGVDRARGHRAPLSALLDGPHGPLSRDPIAHRRPGAERDAAALDLGHLRVHGGRLAHHDGHAG